MLFSSVLFLFLFLPLTLTGYLLVKRPYRNAFLFFASLVFYAWGEPLLVLILIASSIVNYAFSLWVDASIRRRDRMTKGLSSRLLLTGAIVCNLLPLIYYKYSNFIVDSLSSLLGPYTMIGADWKDVALPLGISFYTFQAMSYVIDVYRRDTPPATKYIDFACYLTCFPQLVAGPIVRYKDISLQIRDRSVTIDGFHDGTKLFITGLAKKVLIANTLAKTADHAFSIPVDQLDGLTSWLGTICYTLQIYYDFSGYSDMAIGMGLMLGFNFPLNFSHPYISKSIQEFWHRWHITLSTWFRDYLYIPLGGNRCSSWRTYVNLWTVFLLCGLWHGASWNFVLWGAFHGFFLATERSRIGKALNLLPGFVRHVYALMAVATGWVLFRADTLVQARGYLSAMYGFGLGSFEMGIHRLMALGNDTISALCLGVLFSMPIRPVLARIPARIRDATSPVAYLSIFSVCLASLASNTYNPFLYFRF